MIHDRILDFLDGALAPDDEAELLHTLSVSPEKRAILRDFMKQAGSIARDKEAITVPYAAEQALWQRLDGLVLPTGATIGAATTGTTAAATTGSTIGATAGSTIGATAAATAGATAVGVATKFSLLTASSIAAITLVLGLTAGYFFGSGNVAITAIAPRTTNVAQTQTTTSHQNLTNNLAFAGTRQNIQSQATTSSTNLATAQSPTQPTLAAMNQVATMSAIAPINEVAPRTDNLQATSATPSNIIGPGGIQPVLSGTPMPASEQQSFLQRFEFGITEGFGHGFPNNAATNVSQPILTNSAINAYFQLLPYSNALWAGVSFGNAGVIKKNLFIRAGNDVDKLQDQIVADTSHSQTSYLAAYLQYRLPAFNRGDITVSAGYGAATLGHMLIGDVGLHYDLSDKVGIQFGLRATQFYYDLTTARDNLIASGSGSLVVPTGITDAPPSFNLELATGFFFHF